MSRLRALHVHVLVLATGLLSFGPQRAIAIWVPLSSPKNIPFSQSYPAPARNQVYAALSRERCRFLDGHSVNSITTMHFRGNTEALNTMLQRLSAAPGVTVAVSAETGDFPGDWRIVYDARSMTFQAIVSRRSRQVSLDQVRVLPHETRPAPTTRPESSKPADR